MESLRQYDCRSNDAQKSSECNACVETPFHGRSLGRLLAISLALRAGELRRRTRIAPTALSLACLRHARSTASRIKSAMRALLFTSENVALNASMTSSGTLKVTVAIVRTSIQLLKRPIIIRSQKAVSNAELASLFPYAPYESHGLDSRLRRNDGSAATLPPKQPNHAYNHQPRAQ